MGRKTFSSTKIASHVDRYLKKRGLVSTQLPEDMLRELRRLLTLEAKENGNKEDFDGGEMMHGKMDKQHDHELVSFEMYLAAWIAKRGFGIMPPTSSSDATKNKTAMAPGF